MANNSVAFLHLMKAQQLFTPKQRRLYFENCPTAVIDGFVALCHVFNTETLKITQEEKVKLKRFKSVITSITERHSNAAQRKVILAQRHRLVLLISEIIGKYVDNYFANKDTDPNLQNPLPFLPVIAEKKKKKKLCQENPET